MASDFEELKRYMEFTQEDSRNLTILAPRARPRFPHICEVFYERIEATPGARRILSGPDQVKRLKETLLVWMERLVSGPHDEEYFLLRSRIGRVHVKVGLEQKYMFTAMNVIRTAFLRVIEEELGQDRPLASRVAVSLDKALDLDLAIMLGTYTEDYIARLNRSKRQSTLKRLAAIGEMAAVVAHEVRNPLAGISGAIEVLRDDLPADSPRREVIREMLGQVRHLDEWVRDLLMYARSAALKIEEVDPAALMRGTLDLLSEEPLMRGVRTSVSIPGDAGRHPMDRGQMQEALVNLIRNAADAMGGEGELRLRAERIDGGSMVLSVEDSGPGVSPQMIDEIFKPFFTTRSSGTGLGLSIARRILEAHGGTLTYETGRKGGGRFVASIPPVAAAA